MKSSALAAFAVSSFTALAAPMELSYDRPDEVWTEALPIGNGRLGAMVFGGTEKELLQVNEDTLWTGGPGHAYALLRNQLTLVGEKGYVTLTTERKRQ